MSAQEQALVGRGLTRNFGAGETLTTALREVSLALSAGQVALVLGPSGSGKSTLLAALSGLLQPDCGQVLALGEDLWRLSPEKRKDFRLQHCGFIFQGYNLFPALTARQHLEMVLRWGKGASRQQARRQADHMLSILGLARHGSLLPGQMSGGEQQRVAIGRALVKEPSLCFADEPTGALDWAHGQQVIELLHAATRQRDATVLLVAHDTRLVPYADRVFHMEDGCLSEG